MIPERLNDRRVIASVSGGKDSAAMCLHLAELGIEHDRIFMDTGWEHAKTYEYLRGPLTEKLGPIIELRGEHDFVALARRKAMFPSRVTRFCTVELKVRPAQAYFKKRAASGEDVVNAVGIRRAESRARSQMKEWEWSDSFDCDVWRPLVTWSEADVRAIHARHDLDMNPLYAMGASRVGCWPCIHARKAEIALVAELDLNASAQARHPGEELRHRRTMFSFGGGGRKHYALPILDAVEWSHSKRGEWQPPGAGDGCVRHGLCETEPEVCAACKLEKSGAVKLEKSGAVVLPDGALDDRHHTCERGAQSRMQEATSIAKENK